MNEERALELLNAVISDMIEKEGDHVLDVIGTLRDLGFSRQELTALSFQEADISTVCPENTRIDYLYRDASNYKKPNMAIVSGSISGEYSSLSFLAGTLCATHTVGEVVLLAIASGTIEYRLNPCKQFQPVL